MEIIKNTENKEISILSKIDTGKVLENMKNDPKNLKNIKNLIETVAKWNPNNKKIQELSTRLINRINKMLNNNTEQKEVNRRKASLLKNNESKEVQKEWSDFTKSFTLSEYRELFKDSWYNPDLLALYGVFLVEGTLQDDLTKDERQKLKELSDKMGNLKVEKVYCHEPATRDGKCLRKIVFSNKKSIEISNRPPKYRERLLSKIEKMLDE